MADGSEITYIDEIIKRSFQAKTATENDRLFAIAVVCYILDGDSSRDDHDSNRTEPGRFGSVHPLN